MAFEKVVPDYTYTDYFDNIHYLTAEELDYFQTEVERAQKATGLTHTDIIAYNHDLYDGTSQEALGCCVTSDPEQTGEREEVYITIDTWFIHECFEFWGKDCVGNSLRETLAHELAHLYYWNHGEEHTELTRRYWELIEATA